MGTGDRSCISGLSSASLVRAKGGGGGKKWTFLFFFAIFGIISIFLEDFCQTQSEIGEILMMNFWGVGGPLDFCCWKKRQPGVVASS